MRARFRLGLALMGVAAVTAVLAASPTALVASFPVGSVEGLLVQYRQGVSPRLENGLARVSKFSPVALNATKALGGGMHLVTFEHPTTDSFANAVSRILRSTPDVIAVTPDLNLAASSSSTLRIPATKILVSPSVNPSAVRALKAVDSWKATEPLRGSGSVTWQKPLNLAGAKLAYYRVQISTDSGKTFKLYSKTIKPFIEVPSLTPGKRFVFRVAAVVNKKSRQYLGRSASVSLVTTSAPRAPVLRASVTSGNQVKVSWLPQSIVQAGGLATDYLATVSSSGTTSTCQTQTNFCFVDLPFVAGDLAVKVTATNARGSSSSIDTPKAQDRYFEEQWYLAGEYGANVVNAWPVSSGGVTVAVIDSGITEHPDLDASLIKTSDGMPYGFDFVSNVTSAADGDGWDSDPADPGETSAQGSTWHGTHVTGLIAAQHNSLGIAGVAKNAQILEVRALGRSGGRLSDLMAALKWSAGIRVPNTPINEHPARVINFSIASESDLPCDSIATATFKQIADRGSIVVTAAGNRGVNASESFPANCPNLIAVGANTFRGDLATYSNFGDAIDIVAPGGESADKELPSWQRAILSTFNDGQSAPASPTYAYVSGTSMAAPIVSGTIALLLEVNPRLTTSQVQQVLSQSAIKFAPNSRCFVGVLNCGPGILDAAAAVELAALKNW